jgi:hypothetical protein
VTVHRDGAVSLSGPFGPRGIVGFAVPSAAWYALHHNDNHQPGPRIQHEGADLPLFKTRKLAVTWLLEHLDELTPRDPAAVFDLDEPDIVGALRVSAQRLNDRGAGTAHGVLISKLFTDAAAEIERLRAEIAP